MAEEAWGGAAAACRGAHQSPAFLRGICSGMAPWENSLQRKDAFRGSWGHAGKVSGKCTERKRESVVARAHEGRLEDRGISYRILLEREGLLA